MINNLDPTIRQEAKIFQLSGNDKLENLLEVILVKLNSNAFECVDTVGTSAMSAGERSRLEKLEGMMEKVLLKLDDRSNARSTQSTICEECQKPGHSRQSCYKLKTCYRCQEKGHIERFCKKNANTSALNMHEDEGVSSTSPE